MTDDPSSTAASDRQALLAMLLAEEGLLQARRAPVARRPADAPPVLSYSQERMWFLDKFQDDTASLGIRASLRLRGPVDVEVMRQSLDAIIRRHASLRTLIVAEGGQPRPMVLERSEMPFAFDDVDGDERALATILAAEATRTFDLQHELPIATRVVRVSDELHVFCVTMHHIASDAWSFRVFSAELFQLYGAFATGAPSPLPELEVQYEDYAHWQRNAVAAHEVDQQLAYWRNQLAAPLPQFELPPDHPRPPRHTYDGGQVRETLRPGLGDALRGLSAGMGATTFMTLLSVFELLLARRAGGEEVVIGTPVAGRVRPELEPMIGVFLNTVVLRTDLSGSPTFAELLARVRDVALGAFDNQDLPFEQLLAELQPSRDLSRTPLFQVFFNMTNSDIGAIDQRAELEHGFSYELIEQPEIASKFDLTLYVDDQAEGAKLTLVYNRALYDADTMRHLLDQYVSLLEQVVEDPHRDIYEYSLVTGAAIEFLPDLARPLDTTWYGSVPASVLRAAERCPDRIAVDDRVSQWSYGVLGMQMTRLASWLRVRGIGKGDVVAIYGHRSASLVWAIAGVLASGAAYLVVDPRYPAARLRQYVGSSKPNAWLSLDAAGPPPAEVQTMLDELNVTARLAVPSIDKIDGMVELADLDDSLVRHAIAEIGPDDLACLTFTSGSTGVPKAVQGRHGSLTHFLPWMSEHFGVTEHDRFSMLSGLAHDPIQRDIFWPLWLGATLVVPDPEWLGSSGWLADWMRDERITVTHLTPAMSQLVAQDLDRVPLRDGSLSELRVAFFIGDVLTRRDVARLRRMAPSVQIVNLYGATETQRASAFHVVDPSVESAGARSKEVLPLGKPMPDVQLLLTTAAGQPAGLGEIAEISVRSPHLALGYLDDDVLTAARFVRNTATDDPGDRIYRTGDRGRYRNDGSVEYFGRADLQVQLRGFRIELGEIQAMLGRHPQVRDAVVQLTEDESGHQRLVAYVVPQEGEAPEAIELSRFLRKDLPAHMVPAEFVVIDRVPLTPNGKLDRSALAALDRGVRPTPDAREPRDSLEELLVEIWQDVLARKRVAIDDDFFELGGYSLLATRVFAMIEERTGKRMPISVLFERPTIAELSEAIREEQPPVAWSSLVPIQPSGRAAPFFYVAPYTISVLQFAPLGDALGPDRPLYGLQPLGLDGVVPAHERIEDMATHYIRELKSVQPTGPYLVGGHCSGAWVAFEMARQLEANGDELQAVVLVDQGPPGAERPTVLPHRYLLNRVRFYFHDGRLRHSLAWKFKIITARHLVRRLGPATERYVEQVRETHRRAFKCYSGGTLKHDVTLIRSAESLALEDKGWFVQWADRTEGETTIVDVPGTHANLLVPPFVFGLATELTRAFDAAEAQRT